MIRGLEIGTTWVHADIRQEDSIVLFDAKGNLYNYENDEFIVKT